MANIIKKTLQQWLSWQEKLHPSEIDLGLERVEKVLQRLLAEFFYDSSTSSAEGLRQNFPFQIITIAGTNGKGSTVAMLESILTQAGYKVGSYTSPHILHYNERIKINQQAVSDQAICEAFARIDRAREDISLTYFEFATLAAVDIFCTPNSMADKNNTYCDVVILEVGLGGRLDAVNVVDPDVALVTTVDIDHQDWLGSDINTIAVEKSGVFRQDKPAIYGDSDLPQSIAHKVREENLEFYQFSEDYHYERSDSQWHWLVAEQYQQFNSRRNCSLPQLQGEIQLKNASNVLMVLELLKKSLPVAQQSINRALSTTSLPGRFQIIENEKPYPLILDVAHNEQAAKNLRCSIEQYMNDKKSLPKDAIHLHVIMGMLNDKEISKVIEVFKDIVLSWRIIELDSPRAMPAVAIEQMLIKKIGQLTAAKENIMIFDHFKEAYTDFNEYNRGDRSSADVLLVFGSFHTVSDALTLLNPES